MLLVVGCYNAGESTSTPDTVSDGHGAEDTELAAEETETAKAQEKHEEEKDTEAFEEQKETEEAGKAGESVDSGVVLRDVVEVKDEEDTEETETEETEATELETTLVEPVVLDQKKEQRPDKDLFGRTATVTVVEGEMINLRLVGYDPDGDDISYEFGKPFDQLGKWQTQIGDEGAYSVDIIASDGELSITKPVKVKVLHLNRAPVIQAMEPIFVDEGTTLRLNPVVTDLENDEITLTFSGWMDRRSRYVEYNEAGQYEVTITASDGQANTSLTVPVIVNNVNRAPDFYVVVE